MYFEYITGFWKLSYRYSLGTDLYLKCHFKIKLQKKVRDTQVIFYSKISPKRGFITSGFTVYNKGMGHGFFSSLDGLPVK